MIALSIREGENKGMSKPKRKTNHPTTPKKYLRMLFKLEDDSEMEDRAGASSLKVAARVLFARSCDQAI